MGGNPDMPKIRRDYAIDPERPDCAWICCNAPLHKFPCEMSACPVCWVPEAANFSAARRCKTADLQRLFLGERFDQLDDDAAAVSAFDLGKRLRDRNAFLARQEARVQGATAAPSD